ncbi:peptide MFS transporter [Actinomadura viridis]|uniref:POT family proton-dependent oligopeptide transporter n=1 Tax=Actinomadura viridis TaxID=58110 RepID=A0A931DUG6_9ACTN|nr:oligopeptide:H+ symporter [Actinomadura viridis]MBG6092918.1 POT family proton-dependent oligopeptide transporter [Actinomadura viridis]
MTTTSADPERPATIAGQPRGLATLAGVGLWERFSFYGMQVVLLYYLFFSVTEGGLGLSQAEATSIVGAYGGLVYLSTVIGGWVADRLLGAERTLFYSAVLIMLGHVALAVLPGFTGVWVGLALLVVGSGGQVGNVTSSVGCLYGEGDRRRDNGFMLFYMGLNIGALAGPILTGLARTRLGFHYGFGIAAIGMAIGLFLLWRGRRHLGARGRTVPDPLPRSGALKAGGAAAGVVVLIVLGTVTGALSIRHLATVITAVVLVVIVGYFATMLRSAKVSPVERRRVYALIPMFLVNCVFWALYQQQFTVVQIYAATRVDLHVLGFAMPPEFFNSAVPFFVILLTPLLVSLWSGAGSREPSTPAKFLTGVVLIGLSFLLFLPMAGSGGAVNPPLALAGILLVFTLAELFVSPVQLSLSTKLAPRAFQTQMVALLFLSTAAGSAASGALAGFYSPERESAYFSILGGASLAAAALFALTIPWIRSMLGGAR